MQTFKAKDLLYKISDATWRCGDPGMQYDTTVNRWHTSKNTARINASNPCSEYMFLDDSACNLASLNLLKFAPNGTFDVEAYRHAVDVLITAQEILVDNAGYPTEMIAQELARLPSAGPGLRQPRRAADGRRPPLRLRRRTRLRRLRHRHHVRRSVSAILAHRRVTARRWSQPPSPRKKAWPKPISAQNVMPGGACPGWYINREPFLDVIRMHRASGQQHQQDQRPDHISTKPAKPAWDEALAHGEKHGYRNSQVTVLAPTGTIGFMMDCDTTGIEPDLALVKYKKLVGGGMIKIVNNTVPTALFKLGYDHDEADKIVSYIDATGTIEGAPDIKDEHLAVFDCSLQAGQGHARRSITWAI